MFYRCDGDYTFVLYDTRSVPDHLSPDESSQYGYIFSPTFTDDKIEYATQASDAVTITKRDGSFICKAYKHTYNFDHLENRMYVRIPVDSGKQFRIRRMKNKRTEGGYSINVRTKFEVKHSYFNHLQDAIVKVPDYIRKCLLPNVMSFGRLYSTFSPDFSHFSFMVLDEEYQSAALQMITSDSEPLLPHSCPPPVNILYGPFGSGKTRILARAAYEIIRNGIKTMKPTRILICAHHEQSIETFVYAYFGRIERTTKKKLPFKVILINRKGKKKTETDAHLFMTIDEFSEVAPSICQENHIIVIVTYTMSLNLHELLRSSEGFFTHFLLDEAAQVREPEAITPLSLATRNAKIVLAGDDKQV